VKIRNKITLIFVILTASMLACIFTVIYFLSYQYSESEFFERLAERSLIVGQSSFEQDELSAHLYDEIRDKYLRGLPGEKESIFEIDTARRTIISGFDNEQFSDTFFETIFRNKYAQEKTGEVYHAGLLYLDNQGNFIVVVSASNPRGRAKMQNLRDTLVVSYLAALLLLFVFGRFFSGKVLDPIAAITAKARKISGSNLHLRISAGNESDELAELARTFNSMLDRLEQDFENQTNFISNASHELKNPLTAILGEIEIVQLKDRSIDEYKHALDTIAKEAQRIDDLVGSLLELARADQDHMRLDQDGALVVELMDHVFQDAARLHPDTPLHCDVDVESMRSARIPGNTQLLRVAFWNIVDNACKFSGNEPVHIHVAHSDTSVDIIVIDRGMGIPSADLAHVEETLYRAPNTRGYQGFGIGLALARRIVQLHQGSLLISSDIGVGTRVVLSFPSVAAQQEM
jgi:signal transduction histidine kinase